MGHLVDMRLDRDPTLMEVIRRYWLGRSEAEDGQLRDGYLRHAQGGGGGGEATQPQRVHARKTSRRAEGHGGGLRCLSHT